MNSNKKSTDKKIEFNRELQVTKPYTPYGVSNERITTKNLINEKIKFKKSEQKVIENLKIILKSFKKEGFIKWLYYMNVIYNIKKIIFGKF